MTGLPALATRVIRWQREHGRHGLPWQGSQDPYRVWLSEVMLQQTQVSTVLPYYAQFLKRFPNVQSLAAAHQDEVLALWSGLGYYSRARNLHRCAQVVVQQHGGQFPPTSQALATLPGIGQSTAAAIAAFCFGERAAILDGNVKRVLARVLAFEADLARPPAVQTLWQHARDLLPTQDVDVYTQGLMDLGATLCTLRRPRCGQCPLQASCRAYALGRPEAFPVKSRKLKRGRRSNALLLLQQGGQVLLVQRPQQGVWAGLWSLPEFENEDDLTSVVNTWPGTGEWLTPQDHALTHFDWRLLTLHWTLPLVLPEKPAAPSTTEAPAASATSTKTPAAEVPGLASLQHGKWFSQDQALALGLPAPIRRWLQTRP